MCRSLSRIPLQTPSAPRPAHWGRFGRALSRCPTAIRATTCHSSCTEPYNKHMASELNSLILSYLEALPSSHPDRRFLEGIQEAVAGYVDQTISIPEAQPEPPALDRTDTRDVEPASRPERRTVRGRVAAPPDFKTLPRGSRRGHFPLAEHPDTETTIYWDVYT